MTSANLSSVNLRELLLLILKAAPSDLKIPGVALLNGGMGPCDRKLLERVRIGGIVDAWLVWRSDRSKDDAFSRLSNRNYHIVLPGRFCTCYSFASRVLRGTALTCKHELAVLLLFPGETGCDYRNVDWEVLDDVLKSLSQTE